MHVFGEKRSGKYAKTWETVCTASHFNRTSFLRLSWSRFFFTNQMPFLSSNRVKNTAERKSKYWCNHDWTHLFLIHQLTAEGRFTSPFIFVNSTAHYCFLWSRQFHKITDTTNRNPHTPMSGKSLQQFCCPNWMSEWVAIYMWEIVSSPQLFCWQWRLHYLRSVTLQYGFNSESLYTRVSR